jgi:outer membrane protein
VNKFLRTLLAAGLAVTVTQAAAADYKVAYVHVERILKEAPQTAEMEKEFSGRTAELRRMQKQISDQEASGERSKDKNLASLKLDFQQKQRDVSEDFNLRKNEELASLQDHINKAINTVSESEGFDLVMYSGIAYGSKRVDITDKVLKSLGAAKATP